MQTFQKSSKLIMMTLVFILMISGAGCKSKKKAMEAANAEAERARMEQQAATQRQQQEEEARRKEAEEKARLDAEARAKANEPRQRLSQYLNAISNAGNPDAANTSIEEALTLFSSRQTPVLIVIHEAGGQKDYDKPTTIFDYLNYIKDQKKNPHKIGNLQFDDAGKISEIELVK